MNAFLDALGLAGADAAPDLTDGLRMTRGGRVAHVRPSGNAPELRCYAEADTSAEAERIVRWGLDAAGAALA